MLRPAIRAVNFINQEYNPKACQLLKSNIIGWSALQLKDMRRDGHYVYDKIIISSKCNLAMI
jgi:hypothetical protein